MNEKQCSKCRAVKPIGEFSPYPRNRTGLSSRCKACNVQSTLDYVARNRESVAKKQREWRLRNRDRLLARARSQVADRKRQIMTAYGGHCTCCGETEIAFLAIDHIDGDGAARRKNGEHGQGHKFYRWLIANGFPSGFQVLCFNCNFAKSNGGCPHRRGLMAL